MSTPGFLIIFQKPDGSTTRRFVLDAKDIPGEHDDLGRLYPHIIIAHLVSFTQEDWVRQETEARKVSKRGQKPALQLL